MISAVPAFQDNYIWIIHDSTKSTAAVVDPGEAGPVLDFLTANNTRLEALLITHHHADHCGGIDALLDYAFTADPDNPVAVYGPSREAIPQVTVPLRDGDAVVLEQLALKFSVIDVPGHTAGHIAYFSEDPSNGPILFCGDTLFVGGCGRLFEGTAEQMFTSLQKLAALPDDTAVYCAHEYTLGNFKFAVHARPHDVDIRDRFQEITDMRRQHLPTVPSRISIEKTTNPFLKCKEAQEFAALRKQKDEFRG